jgi:hypothetical protein
MYRTMQFSRPGAVRLVIPSIAAVALAGAAGGVFAANVATPGTNAGQGAAEVEGFSVSGIEYRTDAVSASTSTAIVDAVQFSIVRTDTVGAANQSTAVNDANAEVWIQLRSTSGGVPASSAWTLCDTSVDDTASCPTSALAVPMAEIDEISVIAFDSEADPNNS